MSKRSLGPTIGPKSKLGYALVDQCGAEVITKVDGCPMIYDIQECDLHIYSEHEGTKLDGLYDLNHLLRDLPLEYVERYRVNTERPPKPRQVKRQ